MKVIILRNSLTCLDENNILIGNAFLELGHEVSFGLINSVYSQNYNISVKGIEYKEKLEIDSNLVGDFKDMCLIDFNLVWIMNQPHPNLEKDVYQLLWLASQKVNFVNSIEGIYFLNNKNSLGFVDYIKEYLIESYTSNDFSFISRLVNFSDDKWVLKPTNSGCGSDVFVIDRNESNTRALLQSATGNSEMGTVISGDSILGITEKYTVLQKYIREVKKGEKRVILCAGKITAVHGREIQDGENRSNISQGGKLTSAELSKEETEMCELIGEALLEKGIRFVGIDISFPYLLEFNIVNPGGLYDCYLSSGKNNSKLGISNILNFFDLL